MRADLHLTTVQVGWIIGGYSLPSLLLTLPLGMLADFWGAKRVLVGCLLLYGISGLGSVTAGNFSDLLVWRVLQGIAFAPLATLTISMTADTLPRQDQTMAQSYRSVVASGSEFLQPVMAGYILVAVGNWRPAFLLFAIPLGVAIWALFALPSSAERKRGLRGGYFSQSAGAMRDPAILGVTIGGFARWFLKYGFFAYMPLYLASVVHAGPTEIGYVIGIPGLVGAIVASQAGRFGLGRSGKLALTASLAAFGVCMPAFTIFPNIWWAVAVAAVQGVADGILGPLLNSFISVLPQASVRVTVVSISGLVRNIGKTVAPTLLGPLILASGYSLSFAAVGVLAMAAPIYLAPLFGRRDPGGEPEPAV